MLGLLHKLRSGKLAPDRFQADVVLERIYNLEMSKYIDMPLVQNFGYTTMDIDSLEERFLLSGGRNGTITIFDLVNTNGKVSYIPKIRCIIHPSEETHLKKISRVQWYPFDTGVFTTSSKCKKLRIWDTNSFTPVQTIELEHQIYSHDMSTIVSRQNLIAVCTSDSNIALFDPKSGDSVRQLSGHNGSVLCVKWSTTVPHLLASGGLDKKILLWDVRSARGPIMCLDQLNGLHANKEIESHDRPVITMKFTPDGFHIASCDTGSKMKLWDVSTGKNMNVNYGPLKKYDYYFTFSLEICNNSAIPLIFVANYSIICVFHLYNGQFKKSLVGPLNNIYTFALRHSTQELFGAGIDMRICVWSPCDDRDCESGLTPKRQEFCYCHVDYYSDISEGSSDSYGNIYQFEHL